MRTIVGSIAAFAILGIFGACSSSSSSGSASSADGGGNSGTDSGTADSGDVTCMATAAGGTAENIPCTLGAVLLSGNTEINISSDISTDTDGMSLLIEIKGPPTATTYSAATVIDSQSNFKSADKAKEWEEAAANGTDTRGTFSLQITDPGATKDIGGGATGYASHGKFTGTFVEVSTDGSMDPVPGGTPATLEVTF